MPAGTASALRERDAELLLEVLAPLVTAHAGSLQAADKRLLFEAAREAIPDHAQAVDFAVELSRRKEPIAKQLAASLCLSHTAAFDDLADEILGVLEATADDENWEVRETAGGAVGALLVRRPDAAAVVLRRWSRSPSERLRRAVVLAVKYAARDVPGKAEELLDLVEPLAADGSEYVRKNLGPFALGDGLLPRAPEATLSRLRAWSKSRDEWVRWNVAMAFTAAAARPHAREALPILRVVAGDERPRVQRAVVKALANLAVAQRAAVLSAVSSWGEDPARRAAAAAVRGRLSGRRA